MLSVGFWKYYRALYGVVNWFVGEFWSRFWKAATFLCGCKGDIFQFGSNTSDSGSGMTMFPVVFIFLILIWI